MPQKKYEPKIALKSVEIAWPATHNSVWSFHSFAEADQFLIKRMQQLFAEDEVKFRYRVCWEGGASFASVLTVTAEEAKDKPFLAGRVQADMEDAILLFSRRASLAAMRELVTKPSWQTERMLLNFGETRRIQHLLRTGEGLDAESFQKRWQLLHDCLHKLYQKHPLLCESYRSIRYMLLSAGEQRNRTRFYIEETLKRLKLLAARTIANAIRDDFLGFSASMGEMDRLFLSISSDRELPDERFTALGRELYHLKEPDLDVLVKEGGGKYRFETEKAEEFFSRDQLIAFSFENPTDAPKHKSLYRSLYSQIGLHGLFQQGSRVAVTRQVAQYLRSHYNMQPKEIERLVEACDPLAVDCPGFAVRIARAV